MSELQELTKAVQKEALTRPAIGGKGQDLRQVELDKELNLNSIKKARADLAAGKINLEQFDKTTGRQ